MKTPTMLLHIKITNQAGHSDHPRPSFLGTVKQSGQGQKEVLALAAVVVGVSLVEAAGLGEVVADAVVLARVVE